MHSVCLVYVRGMLCQVTQLSIHSNHIQYETNVKLLLLSTLPQAVISDLYMGDAQFESQPRHKMSQGFHSFAQLYQYFQLVHNYFLPNLSNSLFSITKSINAMKSELLTAPLNKLPSVSVAK